jgi:putative methyltransferase (TIGR04325 family)
MPPESAAFHLKGLATAVARGVLPAPAIDWLRGRLRGSTVSVVGPDGASRTRPEWEMMPDTDAVWGAAEGWSHESIAARQVEKWDAFLESIAAPNPIGRSHEARPDADLDVSAHNTAMTFGYVLGRVLAESGARAPSILDWGGGIGHYFQYARALFPASDFQYVIKDFAALCEAGRKRNPGARFVETDQAALAAPHDLVFASSSLHYARDVFGLLDRLATASRHFLFVTRTPFVERVDDFVVVQRPYRYGYMTEYAGWFLNRAKFESFLAARGLVLEREFMLAERPHVPNAPEQCRYLGLLFRRQAG